MIQEHRKEIISRAAERIRNNYSCAGILAPDISSILERYCSDAGIEIRMAQAKNMPKGEAIADTTERVLCLRTDVHTHLQEGRPRSRFTVAHEMGHFVLGHEGQSARSIHKEEMYRSASDRIQEQEANYFAECLLMPADMVDLDTNIFNLADQFQVSEEVARIRQEEIIRQKRRASGEKRQLPANAVDFLKKAKERGVQIRTDLDGL